MKFLADESFDFGAVRALRRAGFDVAAVAELEPGISDTEVSRRAYQEGRVLLTEDKDFGHLIYARGELTRGVVLVRFPASRRAEMLASVVEVVQRFRDRLRGGLAVVQPGRVRFSRPP